MLGVGYLLLSNGVSISSRMEALLLLDPINSLNAHRRRYTDKMVAHAMKGSRFESRGAKAYGKMLIVAFGLAVLGVMVLHKLREKRILNLILEQKDQQLSSLHLLLQRELDVNKENSKKLEDMKPRLHMLRIQKMELNARLLELQSTIASLQDDIKVVQSAVEDRNGENRMLRNKITEILKDKDAEIDLLKRGTAEEGAKVWPTSNC
uniref:Uncharacterized protein n=1 Tax=Kalanchoe fedtschenkoi TaxID=63787 RepID=A0A7N0U3V1_KALFE